ncbi:MAG: hypothetical protein KDA96_18510 [Planctomycetaceae bacterium]|nr:hypothetical protein [Planctomycetaceae bacterium]
MPGFSFFAILHGRECSSSLTAITAATTPSTSNSGTVAAVSTIVNLDRQACCVILVVESDSAVACGIPADSIGSGVAGIALSSVVSRTPGRPRPYTWLTTPAAVSSRPTGALACSAVTTNSAVSTASTTGTRLQSFGRRVDRRSCADDDVVVDTDRQCIAAGQCQSSIVSKDQIPGEGDDGESRRSGWQGDLDPGFLQS